MRMTWNSVLYRWWQLYYTLEDLWWKFVDAWVAEECPCCLRPMSLRDMVDLTEKRGYYTRLCEDCARLVNSED